MNLGSGIVPMCCWSPENSGPGRISGPLYPNGIAPNLFVSWSIKPRSDDDPGSGTGSAGKGALISAED